jgi:predicted ribonuclease YlaK
MKKNYVLDTNVLLYDPNAIFKFEDNDLVIPIYVIEEVDQFKREGSERGRNARSICRHLDELRERGSLSSGVPMEGGGSLRVAVPTVRPELASALDKTAQDQAILQTAIDVRDHSPNPTIFVTMDTNLRIRADAVGVSTENYENQRVDLDRIDRGLLELELDPQELDRFFHEGAIEPPADAKMHANLCVLLRDARAPSHTALGRYHYDRGQILPLRVPSSGIMGLRPRNKEQTFALELLLDNSIRLVTVLGKAGTGKAQPLDARVLTPDGWRRMGQIEPGHRVLTPGGEASTVVAVFPQGVKEVYRVRFTDGSSTECCREHLWFTQTTDEQARGEVGSVKSLEAILGCLRSPKTGAPNHAIPLVAPLPFPEKNLLGDPYALGCQLAAQGGALPELALLGSIEQRVAVLQGLMDTVGVVDKRGCALVAPPAALREGFTSLVQSLGGTVTMSPGATTDLLVSVPAGIAPFRAPQRALPASFAATPAPQRFIDCVELVGRKEAQCILIDHPEHLYITDDFVVTHNTLLALAAGLKRTIEDETYARMLVSRPVIPMGRDVGFLPGDIDEKLNPWMQPIFDNLEQLLAGRDQKNKKDGIRTFQELQERGQLHVEPLTYIRGRSLPYQYLIVDEAQNLTPHEVKTIVTRCGEGTKVVLTGDPFQIDNPYVDSTTNGLSVAAHRFKGQPLAAHLVMTKGERSELAEIAANLL